MLLPVTAKKTANEVIEIGGCEVTKLRESFRTPLYIIDIETVRGQCQEYRQCFDFGDFKSEIIYASKAFCTIPMCQLIRQSGLSIDVSTGGELFTALRSGFEAEKIYFHGNNKSMDEIKFALNYKVGTFIVDNFEELETINLLAKERDLKQKIMLRITPGIKAHTHKYIQTGSIESKFGFSLHGGIAHKAVKKAAELENVDLIGLHSHIGSQIFNIEVYDKLIETLAGFIREIKDSENIAIDQINIGGGLGIRYMSEDEPATIREFSEVVHNALAKYTKSFDITIKKIYLEPGRSIIGNAGTTLYEVGTVKCIPGVKNYISIDGGMSDNIRPILYQAKYEAWVASKAGYIEDIENGEVRLQRDKSNPDGNRVKYTIVGKHCESGDVIIEDIILPEVKNGDLMLVGATGAYCYSMSSNYNGQPKSAIAAVENGNCWLWVERQSYEDLVQKDKKLFEVQVCESENLFSI
jgi:diaminopimelate decarboxylase